MQVIPRVPDASGILAGRQIRVLQLEGVAEDAERVQDHLRSGGLSFVARRVDGDRLLRHALSEFSPHLVISEVRQPSIDGRRALAMLREESPNLPLIYVSREREEDIAPELIRAGAADFVPKHCLARLMPAVARALLGAGEARARQLAEAAVQHERLQAERRRREHAEAMRSSLEEAMRALAKAVAMRDPYTAGHEVRVANLAGAIARRMGLPPDRVRGIELAASLHDVGKISVPLAVLSKPEALTPAEMEIVRGHAQAGYEIIRNVQFTWPIAEMVRQHHERLDGSGYPRGLKGDQIMLDARIISVADVVDAMSGARPYRAALGVEAALAEIAQGRGRLYDPAVVDACLDLFHRHGYRIQASLTATPPLEAAA